MTDSPPNPRELAQRLQRLLASGQEDEAVEACDSALRASADDPSLLGVAGPFFVATGAFARARQVFERLAAHDPHDPNPLAQLASACRQAGDIPGALAAADRLLALAPNQPQAIAMRGDLLYVKGEHREALEFLGPHARASRAHPGLSVTFARVCRALGRHWDAISVLNRAFETPGLPPPLACDACFQLAKAYDAAGRYDDAFAAAVRANALKGARFDPDAFDRRVAELERAWTPDAFRALPRAARFAPRPVLIVGMPRSGTTLVEQILASHPDVSPGGELAPIPRLVVRWSGGLREDPPLLTDLSRITAAAVAREGERYAGALPRPGPVATDKMPLNVLHLGAAALVAPHARVVLCTRDPIDTCLSCFMQHFGGSNPFAYDLVHLGRFHRAVERVASFWRGLEVLPMFEVRYESLVADREPITRALLEFLGLPWDDRCLRHHENDRVALTLSNDQVRRPLYSASVARWRHYDRHLAPLRAALGL